MDNNNLIPLQFDKNGFLQCWIDKEDPIWGFSLWKRDNKNSDSLVTKIPKKFLKQFDGIKLTEKYRDAIATTIVSDLMK